MNKYKIKYFYDDEWNATIEVPIYETIMYDVNVDELFKKFNSKYIYCTINYVYVEQNGVFVLVFPKRSTRVTNQGILFSITMKPSGEITIND